MVKDNNMDFLVADLIGEHSQPGTKFDIDTVREIIESKTHNVDGLLVNIKLDDDKLKIIEDRIEDKKIIMTILDESKGSLLVLSIHPEEFQEILVNSIVLGNESLNEISESSVSKMNQKILSEGNVLFPISDLYDVELVKDTQEENTTLASEEIKCNLCGEGNVIFNIIIIDTKNNDTVYTLPVNEDEEGNLVNTKGSYDILDYYYNLENDLKKYHQVNYIGNCTDCPNSQIEYYDYHSIIGYGKYMEGNHIPLMSKEDIDKLFENN